jgi:hypothetical protein
MQMEIIATILGLLFAIPSVILGCLELCERWGKLKKKKEFIGEIAVLTGEVIQKRGGEPASDFE